MRILVCAVILGQCGVCSALAQADFRVERDEVVYIYGAAQPRSIQLKAKKAGPGVVAEEPVLETNSRFMRLHLTIERGGGLGDWTLEAEPRGGPRIALEIPRGCAGAWSPEIPGDSAAILLSTTKATTDVQIRIDKIMVSVPEIRPESITTDRKDIEAIKTKSPEIQAWGQSVARLRLVSDSDRGFTCTGFIVGDRLMMTNQHCVDSAETACSALVDFKFDTQQAVPTVSRVSRFLFASYPLDYALVELDKQPLDVRPLSLSAAPFTLDQTAMVIQHPAGEYKQVSIINCMVSDVVLPGRRAKSDFGHLCNTLGGSSGSPVMDASSGVVMGLHHLGFRDGMASPSNQGVLLGQILDDIRTRDSAVFARLKVTP